MAILLKKQGKNLLENTAVSQTVANATYTVNKDKTVTVSRESASGTTYIELSIELESGSYILSGCPNGGSTSSYCNQIYSGSTLICSDIGSGKSFTLEEKTTLRVIVGRISGNTTVSNLVFKPMIRLASITDDTYEPHRPGSGTVNSIFANVNGEKKKILSVWVNKDGVPVKIFKVKTGLFIAVGVSGESYFSTDGNAWNSMSGLPAQNFNAVTYGDRKFVAVGASGATAISTDYITWESSENAGTTALHGVAYGDGIFVAVGQSGAGYYSEDGGKTWKASSGLSGNFRCIAYGNGVFIAGNTGGGLYYSTDGGKTWQQVSITYVGGLYGAVYADGKFVVVGNSGAAYSSTDGKKFTVLSGLPSQNFRGVAYGEGKFVAVGVSGIVAVSADLTNGGYLTDPWSSQTISAATFNEIVYGDDTFVILGNEGENYISTDAVNWYKPSGLPVTNMFFVCYACN